MINIVPFLVDFESFSEIATERNFKTKIDQTAYKIPTSIGVKKHDEWSVQNRPKFVSFWQCVTI